MLSFIFLGTILPTSRPWRRERTAREDSLHDQIQAAMNWSPEMFTQREDGRWFNARGEEAVCMSLEEALKKYSNDSL